MKISLRTTTASILALIIASPAFGKMPYPGFERDMQMAFENDGEPMELALLSEQEMKETKGALVWPGWIVRTLVTGGSYGLGYGVSNHGVWQWSGASDWMLRGAIVGLFSVHPLASPITVPLDVYIQSRGGVGALRRQLADYAEYGPSYP